MKRVFKAAYATLFSGLLYKSICCGQGSGNFEIWIGPADDVINEPISKKKICVYHLSRKLMTIGSPITPFKKYTSTPLYDGSPGTTSMIKAGVINKYSQICKKKEKKKEEKTVLLLFPPPQGFPKLFINNWFPSCISAKTAGNRRDGTKRLSWT